VRGLEAQAVRPQQEHALAPRVARQGRGQLRPDAVGDDQRRLAADAAGHLQRGHQVARGQRDDGQVGPGLRQVGQRAAGLEDVEEHQRARVALRAQGRVQDLAQRRLAVLHVGAAGEDGDGLGGEERGQVVLVHGRSVRDKACPVELRRRFFAPLVEGLAPAGPDPGRACEGERSGHH
jgi:hypothetical protein